MTFTEDKKIKQEKEINQKENKVDKKKKIKKILQTIYKLKDKILKNKKQIKELPLIFLAKEDNIKKKTSEECKIIKKKKRHDFFKKIFLIIDDLEKIIVLISNINNKDDPKLRGISLIKKSLLDLIKKNNIRIEGKIDEIYNHEKHKLNINKENAHKYLKIKKVLKNGYSIDKKLLRKALVDV
ncbi:MAG: nucleotide exchange factor GrpE [Buchnera aphidicola (Periphyllus acericola)]|uniref:nucleotide exchange factor GrpE n=1 Tax=Buchnera aphidicola TaxID=9 RepID=UPI0030CDBA1E|nr:nucleotide exchange factor GrpE [Buchnera aphidicola (Periphyllus acericola)]